MHTATRKIGDFYTSFMDETVIEKRGASPLRWPPRERPITPTPRSCYICRASPRPRAQDWRTIWRDKILYQLTTTNEQSPDAIRVRAVRNFDAWYAAYDVKSTDNQYLAPSERVRIW